MNRKTGTRHAAVLTKIAYILLGHQNVDDLVRLAQSLTRGGDCVAIHFDRRAGQQAFRALKQALAGDARIAVARRRLRCGWGGWSLVRASLLTLRLARQAFPDATHYYLISGDCRPIKSARQIHDMLEQDGRDRIECHDFLTSNWIKTGMKEDRLIYRHYFNERRQTRAFYTSLAMQRRLGLSRKLPHDLRIRIGSQWWCLRRETIDKILGFCRRHQAVLRFFSTTWIPDETFFQTLVHHTVPRSEIRNQCPTFLLFSDYGLPVVFHDDHASFLRHQDAFFARKLCPDAARLRQELEALYASEEVQPDPNTTGQRHYEFVANLGRHGARHAQRIWEVGSSVGQDRKIFVISCKKRHVAGRLANMIGSAQSIPSLGYLFHEEDVTLPDLGGMETKVSNRNLHRRSFLRMLFDQLETNRLILCVEPSDLDILQDLSQDTAELRVLSIDCTYSDDYLSGHAQRIGLPTPCAKLTRSLRNGIKAEEADLTAAAEGSLVKMSQSDSADTHARALHAFCALSADQCHTHPDFAALFAD